MAAETPWRVPVDAEGNPIAVGHKVTLHRLQGRVDLNGQEGTLVSFVPERNRWNVQLAAEIVSIKPGMLSLPCAKYLSGGLMSVIGLWLVWTEQLRKVLGRPSGSPNDASPVPGAAAEAAATDAARPSVPNRGAVPPNQTAGTTAIGIDLGTTFSSVAVWRNNTAFIIPNEEGNRSTPSYVGMTHLI